jgi:hypothetical protein
MAPEVKGRARRVPDRRSHEAVSFADVTDESAQRVERLLRSLIARARSQRGPTAFTEPAKLTPTSCASLAGLATRIPRLDSKSSGTTPELGEHVVAALKELYASHG